MFVFCVCPRLAVAAAVLASCFFGAARADDLQLPRPFFGKWELPAGRVETSNGVDVTGTSMSAYGTAVIAPFGSLREDGLRLKLYGNYGTWSYQTKRIYCPLSAQEKKQLTGVNLTAECNAIANRQLSADEQKAITEKIAPLGFILEGDQLYYRQPHNATRYDVAVMPGYQVSWSGLILKAYIGPAMETRAILPLDLKTSLNGTYWGAETAIESWMALATSVWLTADGSFFTGTQAYSAALRLGYQPLSWLTLGPEIAAFGDEENDSARAGSFLRFTVGKTEATLSGGISADYDGKTSPYGQASVYVKF